MQKNKTAFQFLFSVYYVRHTMQYRNNTYRALYTEATRLLYRKYRKTGTLLKSVRVCFSKYVKRAS